MRALRDSFQGRSAEKKRWMCNHSAYCKLEPHRSIFYVIIRYEMDYRVHHMHLLHFGCMRPKREKLMTSLLKEVCSSAVADISDPRLCSLEAEGLNAASTITREADPLP